MTITNQIRVAQVDSYSGEYATVKLRERFKSSDDSELKVEDLMIIQVNRTSQALPPTGADVLVAFDNVGDAYVIGTIGSENQATPYPGDTGVIAHYADRIEINGDSDNAVRFSVLQTAFNQLKDEYDNFVTNYLAHLHVSAAPGADTSAPKPPIPPLETPKVSTANIDPAKIDEVKVS